jgi:hypothetical protein
LCEQAVITLLLLFPLATANPPPTASRTTTPAAIAAVTPAA